jgi:mono/diheme cytochrome c family protein
MTTAPRNKIRIALLAGMIAASIVAGSIEVLSELRLNRTFDFEAPAIKGATDAISIARGRHLADAVAQCAHCHGQDFGGRVGADDWLLGRLHAPNLTSGSGGLGRVYSDSDFARAIRFGVDRRGHPLLVMPAQYLRALNDRDLAALIGFIRSLPPVDRETPPRIIGPLTRLAIVAGFAGELIPAEIVARTRSSIAAAPDPTGRHYGEYLVDLAGCRVCHHPNLQGGLHPLAAPQEPVPPDITLGGSLALWNKQDFIHTMRTGVTPVGRQLDARYMPWPHFAKMTDNELGAIWGYLTSIGSRAPLKRNRS